jgi:hypothetical protein
MRNARAGALQTLFPVAFPCPAFRLPSPHPSIR